MLAYIFLSGGDALNKNMLNLLLRDGLWKKWIYELFDFSFQKQILELQE